MPAKTIVITRPKGDEAALRDALLARNHHVIHEPVTEIFLRHTARTQIDQALLNAPDAIILTSGHGAGALALLTELRDDSLLCVGQATAEAAQALGFTRVSSAGGNVDRLIDYILDSYDEEARFLYLSGEQVRADLADILAVRGMEVERIVGYEALASQALSDTLVEQLRRGQLDAVTFFSPRTAQIFATLVQQAGLTSCLPALDAFCLSQAIADIAQAQNWKNLFVAEQPTLASLLRSIDNAYGNLC